MIGLKIYSKLISLYVSYMKAVIVAAGLGKRLLPNTKDIPKE